MILPMENQHEAADPFARGTIVTVGMFDGVHVGHRHILDQLTAKARELELQPVVVTFDQHPRIVLGKDVGDFRLLSDVKRRRSGLCNFFGYEVYLHVIHFDRQSAMRSACQFVKDCLLDQLNMKALVLGYDNMFGSKANNDFDQLPRLAEESGFQIVVDTPVEAGGVAISSTRIRHALKSGTLDEVKELLGRNYAVAGTVVRGRGVGKTLGYPTANISLDEPMQALPKEGVYAVSVVVEGGKERFPAMANLGPQPTFDEKTSTFEVNIIGSSENLYEKHLTIEFLVYLRETRKFASVDELVSQLERDRSASLAIFNQ